MAAIRIILVGLIVIVPYLYSETLVLQNGLNGYDGCTDTYVVMGSNNTQGLKDKLVLEGYHCPSCVDQRVLIRFDLSGFPSATKISKASIALYSTDQPRPGGSTVTIHKITNAWEETEASWIYAKKDKLWEKEGADFTTDVAATYKYGEELNEWHTITITEIIQEYIQNPESNNGLLMYMEPIMHTIRYLSSQNSIQSQRPKLLIEGSTVPIVQNIKRVYPHKTTIKTLPSSVIISTNNTESYSLLLYNNRGQQLFNIFVSQNAGVIPTDKLSAGLYTICLQKKKDHVSYTIMIR